MLWEKITKNDDGFGNPGGFCDAVELQEWYSFTATMKDSAFHDHMENFIKKTMADCTGEEMLQKLWYHLKLQDMMTPIMETGKINCIPVAMPFIDSLFMPRSLGDRPFVLPKGTTNFAFLGQFAEVNKDCVFTVEYSVRCAMEAVYGLFEAGKEVTPVYDSIHMPSVLISAAQALTR